MRSGAKAYTVAEEKFIHARRAAGKSYGQIQRDLHRTYGTRRSRSGIRWAVKRLQGEESGGNETTQACVKN